jgi:hypothetical protein
MIRGNLKIFDVLKRKALIEVSKDPKSTPVILENVTLHLEKPWISGYRGMALSPLRPNLDDFFQQPLFRTGRRIWFYPSTHWWIVHANASHPPGGAGCDAKIHAEFLTAQGKNAEFLYASILDDGSIRVLTPRDFQFECAWWARNF